MCEAYVIPFLFGSFFTVCDIRDKGLGGRGRVRVTVHDIYILLPE